MNKKMSKRQKDMKSKLMAAICMLLVSSIMMVSTTYAWFTLSTAPEVTGITTAVGANGNLEMALLPTDGLTAEQATDYGIKSDVGDSMSVKDASVANVTWGNLVDLGATDSFGNYYGLDKIKLYPAALNYLGAEDTTNINTSAFLKTPSYGADGRVAELKTGTVTGVYTGTSFMQKIGNNVNPAGVRVIGNVSGMTERQIAFRDALSQASSAATNAARKTAASLNDNGTGLGSIVLKFATTHTYDVDDKNTLTKLINALDNDGTNGEPTGPLVDIATSIRYYAYAYEIYANENYASKQNDIMTCVLTELTNKLTDSESAPSIINTMVTKLSSTNTNVTKARNELESFGADGSYTEEQLKNVLNKLVDTSKVTLNGSALSGLDQATVLRAYVKDGGLFLTLPTDSGVYADIADHVGDYSAQINIPADPLGAEYADVDVPCTMQTATNVKPTYQSQASSKVGVLAVPGMTDSTAAPISDYYGYIIDLAFKTNASQSYLKLQTEAMDRVYNSDTTHSSDATMGSGSTMTFTSSSQNFPNPNMMELMKNIKIIFFDPGDGLILAKAALVEKSAVYEGKTVTMSLKIDSTAEDNKIVDLVQNTATRVSVLVYLDGENVTNADVAFDSATSMTGSLNLQFASSATLKPMVYSDFSDKTASGTSTVDATVTGLEGGSATAAYSESRKTIAVQIKDSNGKIVTSVTGENAGVKINGDDATYNDNLKVWYVIVEEKLESVTVAVSGTVTVEEASSSTTETTASTATPSTETEDGE